MTSLSKWLLRFIDQCLFSGQLQPRRLSWFLSALFPFFLSLFLLGCNSATFTQTEGNVNEAHQREIAARQSADCHDQTSAAFIN